jgi:hypothetical protein
MTFVKSHKTTKTNFKCTEITEMSDKILTSLF